MRCARINKIPWSPKQKGKILSRTISVAETSKTIRKRIIDLLSERNMNARDLSQALGIPEKELYKHLIHVEKSVSGSGKNLIVRPFQCLKCGYSFKGRKRFSPPGRCPKCKSTYLEKPYYEIR